VAEQPHARFYRGLPPVVRHQPRRWLIIGAGFAIALSVPAASVTQWYGLIGPSAVIKMGGAFVVGGVVGFAFGRRWWAVLLLYAAGFAVLLAALPTTSGFEDSVAVHSSGDTAAWFNWVIGVSAGAGVRVLIRRHRLAQPAGSLQEHSLRNPGPGRTPPEATAREPWDRLPLR